MPTDPIPSPQTGIDAEAKRIRETYTTVNGRITSPGKFEGQPIYVPWFWEQGLNGCADRDNGRTYGFDITADDRATWPELAANRRTVKLQEDGQGFVREV